MKFPVYLKLLGLQIHPHLLFEVLGYTLGFQLYLLLRRKWTRPTVSFEENMWIIVACIFGALIGTKLLAWFESPLDYLDHWNALTGWLGGKTIVGGLLGGWMGVEWMKKWLGISYSTGDLYVFPLILGMCLGRIGCFLTGLDDHTYGIATTLPWSVDFGDGITRHPTQLYEIAFLVGLGIYLFWHMQKPHENGALFRWFMFSYLAFRFLIEFIKPRFIYYFGLSMIQLACIFGMIICWRSLRKHDFKPQTLKKDISYG